MIEENEIQYFAGGATWDNEDKTQEFLDENKWQNGYAQDTAIMLLIGFLKEICLL